MKLIPTIVVPPLKRINCGNNPCGYHYYPGILIAQYILNYNLPRKNVQILQRHFKSRRNTLQNCAKKELLLNLLFFNKSMVFASQVIFYIWSWHLHATASNKIYKWSKLTLRGFIYLFIVIQMTENHSAHNS